MLGQYILFLLVLNPAHELNKDPELLNEVTGYVEEAVETFHLPTEPSRLAHFIYRESGWNHEAIGKVPNRFGVILNEGGYAQVHGRARRLCMQAGYDPDTRRGGVMCAGYLMHYGMTEDDACAKSHPGDLEAAIRWYASGSCYKAKKKMAERKKDWAKGWRRIVDGDFSGTSARVVAWRKRLAKDAKNEEMVVTVNWGG
ncbi:MAG: hypothetical protein JW704_09830 [Anaerolineaceae bacterium]|nr:hypothetical protein [Anaerolineaceae bacterium]